jgi:two-component system LytT family response regulator
LQPIPPTAVVADDDSLARARIKDLGAETGLVDIVAEVADGRAAVRAIDELKPTIAFLDIRMPILDGLQVLEAIEHQPAVIFTTAYGD